MTSTVPGCLRGIRGSTALGVRSTPAPGAVDGWSDGRPRALLYALSGPVDVRVGCQRKSFGTGQISNGSSGRSAHRHHVCRSAHRHNARQVRRPSSSRFERTRPPDSIGRWHSGQAGASLVMERTLTERPLRPEATWDGHCPWAVEPLTCADGALAYAGVLGCAPWLSRSWTLSRAAHTEQGF